MTQPAEKPLEIVAALENLGQISERMGLQWGLRYATVVSVNPPTGTYDGDFMGTAPIPLIPLGINLVIGHRVAVLFVPPAGNYVISNLTTLNLASQNSVYASADSQSHSSGGFNDIIVGGNPLTMEFIKYRDDTRIACHFHMSAFVTAVNTGILGAVNINGFDYGTAFFLFNFTSSHLAFSSSHHLPQPGNDSIPAGTYTVTMRWGRASGAGTIQMDGNDQISCLLAEAPPE